MQIFYRVASDLMILMSVGIFVLSGYRKQDRKELLTVAIYMILGAIWMKL